MVKEYTIYDVTDEHCGIGEIVKDFMGNSWRITRIVEASEMKYDKVQKRIRPLFTCKVVEA